MAEQSVAVTIHTRDRHLKFLHRWIRRDLRWDGNNRISMRGSTLAPSRVRSNRKQQECTPPSKNGIGKRLRNAVQ